MKILDRLTDKLASRVDKKDFLNRLKEKYKFKITAISDIDKEAEFAWQRIKKSHMVGAFETVGIVKSDIVAILGGLKRDAIENKKEEYSPIASLNRADRRKMERSSRKGDANRRR